jgi:xanthine/uracil permease
VARTARALLKRFLGAVLIGVSVGTLFAYGCSYMHETVIEPEAAIPLVQPSQFQVFPMRHDYDA